MKVMGEEVRDPVLPSQAEAGVQLFRPCPSTNQEWEQKLEDCANWEVG